MVVPSGFEVFGDAYVEMRVWISRRGLVYDVASVAFPVEGAVILFGGLAVAFFFFFGVCLFLLLFQYLLVVPLYNSFHVGCATVRNLECVPVQNGCNLWCLGKCLLTSSKNFFPNLVLRAILNGGL